MSGRPCREGFEALSFEADVSDESDVVRMFESVAQWGQLKGLVNNAGLLMGPSGGARTRYGVPFSAQLRVHYHYEEEEQVSKGPTS